MPLIKPNDQCYMDTNTVVVTKVYGLGKCYTHVHGCQNLIHILVSNFRFFFYMDSLFGATNPTIIIRKLVAKL